MSTELSVYCPSAAGCWRRQSGLWVPLTRAQLGSAALASAVMSFPSLQP